jgi:uncharacterized repeat protein (TIGR02543 family)
MTLKRSGSRLLTAAALALFTLSVLETLAFTGCAQEQGPVNYTVTFHTNGGGEILPQTVQSGGKASPPSPAPTLEGYTLDGWYTSTDYTTNWNFDTDNVTTNLDLYAKWTQSTYIVTFNTGDSGSSVTEQRVAHGSAATRPATKPTRTGYDFDDWFAANAEAPYGFNSPVTANITLYAKWKPLSLAVLLADMAGDAAANTVKTYTLPSGNETYNTGITLTTANCPVSVSIDGGGRVIAGTANRFTIESGVTITLKNITFKNIPFTVAAGGSLVLDNGAVVTENAGTGITMNGESTAAKGTLEMRDGSSVTKNSDSGVKLKGTGVFTMSGGEISGNSGAAADDGGGVSIWGTGAAFTMNAGTISGNTAQRGGGVLSIDGVFTMNGGEISGNSASLGGGVCLIGSNAVDANGKIRGNPQESGTTAPQNKGWIHGNTSYNIHWP